MRRSASTTISLFLLSILCALVSVSGAWVHLDKTEASFAISEPYTHLQVDSGGLIEKDAPEKTQKLKRFLSQHSLALIAISYANSNPSIVGFDPAHKTWFPQLSETQALAITGTYSAQVWKSHQKNPYLPREVSVIGTFTLPPNISYRSNQVVQQLSPYALPLGNVVVSTTNSNLLGELAELLHQMHFRVRLFKPLRLTEAIIQNPTFLVTVALYVFGLIASILVWGSQLQTQAHELLIHHEYGGTPWRISLERTRIHLPSLLISCLCGTCLTALLLCTASGHALSRIENIAILIGAAVNTCILTLAWLLTSYIHACVIIKTHKEGR